MQNLSHLQLVVLIMIIHIIASNQIFRERKSQTQKREKEKEKRGLTQ